MHSGVQGVYKWGVDNYPQHGVALFTFILYSVSMQKKMTVQEAGRLGALVTNKKLTSEMRRRAAKKGWRNRRKFNG